MPQKEQTTTSVDPYNILCGRGKDTLHNSGNRRYRKQVLEWGSQYVAAPRRFEKSLLVQALVEKIKADGGRFLKRQNTSRGPVLIELSMKETLQKVGHSLRDTAATIVKSKDNKAGVRTKAYPSKSVEAKKAHLSGQADARTMNITIGPSRHAFQQKIECPEPHLTSSLSSTPHKDQKSSSKTMPQKEQADTSVDPYNILCGRDKDTFHNSGNRQYRKQVLEWVPQYVAAPRRLEKSLVVQALVEKIKADGGRFLRRQSAPGGSPVLVELSMKQALQKVGHSLRDTAASIAKSKGKNAAVRTKAYPSKSLEAKKVHLSEQSDARMMNFDMGNSRLAFLQKIECPDPHLISFLSNTPHKDQESSSKKLPPKDQATSSVNPYNILCGRDKDTLHNSGNRRYRKQVLEWVSQYVAAPRRLEKSLVVRALLGKIKADGGRFLKRQSTPGGSVLVELSMKQTLQKVGHSLRDTAATIVKSKDNSTGVRPKAYPSKSVEAKKVHISEQADARTMNFDLGTSGSPDPHLLSFLSNTPHNDQECPHHPPMTPGITAPPKEQTTTVVDPYNILCGRDKDTFHNSGNRRYRKQVLKWVSQYVAAPQRFEKSLIVQALVEEIKADGGRFLKRQSTPGRGPVLVELSMKQTIQKVGHSLRDMAVTIVKSKDNNAGRRSKAYPSKSVEAKKAHLSGQADA